MVTVHDVASRSGVSIATVSRTLRAPDRVAPETRERVLEAVRDLGYRPNRAASGLRGGRTGVIGLVVPDIVNPYFASLTKGAQMRCRERGYGLVVVDTNEAADVEAAELDALAPQIDGIVLASSRLDDEQLARVAASTPCVLVNRTLDIAGEPIPAVMLDERTAADAVFGYLAGLGHARIAYVGGPARSWSQVRRALAMREAAAAVGAELVELGHVTPDVLGGQSIAQATLETGATAVIAYNDLVAAGILARWRDLDVRVPEEMSLVGFDNTSVTELFLPRLTSVGPDLRVLGEAAIDLLLDRIEARGAAANGADASGGAAANGADASGGDSEASAASTPAAPEPLELPGILEVRGSTGPAPVR